MNERAPSSALALPSLTGRAAFLSLLASEGVEVMFGNPGTTELAIMEALSAQSSIEFVLGLQEAIVVGMADGYARARPTVSRPVMCTSRLVSAMHWGRFTTHSSSARQYSSRRGSRSRGSA